VALQWGELMTPWDDPHSLADGILDDETYDWLGVFDAIGGWGDAPVVASEDDIVAAHQLARRRRVRRQRHRQRRPGRPAPVGGRCDPAERTSCRGHERSRSLTHLLCAPPSLRCTVVATSVFLTPSRGHRLALGTAAVVAVGLVSAYASVIGAQPASDPIRTEIVSVDPDGSPQRLPAGVVPAMSDTGAIVVYETIGADSTGAPPARHRRSRTVGSGSVTASPAPVGPSPRPAAWRLVSAATGASVAYTVVTAENATLTAVDRCATPVPSPLPIGTPLDRIALDVSAPETQSTRNAGIGDARTGGWGRRRRAGRVTIALVRRLDDRVVDRT
jgi:hypothetical protein